MDFTSVYFLGAGGIGMSALVRYFLQHGKHVAGYDLTETDLTRELVAEGADLHYRDDVSMIPDCCRDNGKTLVVVTPAIPQEHGELGFFKSNGFRMMKRSEVLGLIVNIHQPLCVAGTHGKTTTSTLLSHILTSTGVGCNAFLGGISLNYDSNLLVDKDSQLYVVEADEFDRSFLRLRPRMTVVTAMDADHLDIYNDYETYVQGFRDYVLLITDGGVLIKKAGLPLTAPQGVTTYTYAVDEGDFHAANIRAEGGELYFDFIGPDVIIRDIRLGVPLYVNIENSVAAIAMALLNGAAPEAVREAVGTFRGVRRRFDFWVKDGRHVLISDYAHHPVEIRRSIESVRFLFPGRKLTGVFQPHLYTRTRDFYKEFASSLSLLDEVVLLDIYPARERPIEGVTSQLILDEIAAGVDKKMCRKDEVLRLLKNEDLDVVMLIGAGNIDTLAPELSKMMS